MNVQDVINAALEQARGSSSSVTIAEQRDVGACQSEDVTKLAAALNFIGTHLEDDETKVAASKDYAGRALGASVAAGALSGALGARKAKKIYREHGIDPRDIEGLSGMLGGAARGAVGGGLSGLVGGVGGAGLGDDAGSGLTPGVAVGGALGAVRQYRHHTQGARRQIRTHANIKRREAEREKTSSVDDVLLRAAEFGKASLMSKLAEDRLEDDAEKLAYTPSEAALLGSVGLGALGGYMGARSRDKILAKGGVDPYEARIYGMPGRGRAAIGGAEAGAVGSLMTGALLHGDFSPKSMLAGGAIASALNYLNHRRKAHKTVRNVRSHRAEAELKKLTAEKSAHLQYAAQVGKAALIEKLAEDRINPAKIDAGPADAFSGEVMPASSPVFGGAMSNEQLIAMKAQKVRDRINSDMHKYVSNVGDGYELNGYLSTFNK